MSMKNHDTPPPCDSSHDKHQVVMDAITACIERHGLRKTRMDDIAHRAGMSRVSLYREYGNRDKLINSFLAHRSRQFNERIQVKIRACRSIEEALECYLLTAALQAAKDVSIRELVEVHHVFHSALNDSSSPIKKHISELWNPILKALCPPDSHIRKVDPSEVVDWIILMESNLILVVVESGWNRQRLQSLIRNFLIPAFTIRSPTGS